MDPVSTVGTTLKKGGFDIICHITVSRADLSVTGSNKDYTQQ